MIHSKSIFSNIVHSFGQTALAVIITIFVNAFIARTLGPEEFGIFSLGIAITSIFLILTSLGTRPVTVRKVAGLSRSSQSISSFISRVVYLRIFLGFFTVLAVALFLFLMNYPATIQYAIIILSLGLFFDAISTTFRDLFQGIERMDYVAVTDMTIRVTSAILAISLLFVSARVYSVMIAYTLASITAFLYTLNVCLKIGVTVKPKSIDFMFVKNMLSEGFPFLFTGLVSILFFRMDTIIISKLLSSEAVGYYNASANLVARLAVIPDAVVSALFPVFIRKFTENDNLYITRIFKQQFTLISVTGLFACIPFYFSAQIIITTIYGTAFTESICVMEILALSIPFAFISRLLIALLQAIHAERTVMILTCLSLATNFILDLLLIPSMQICGAACATVLSQFFLCVALLTVVYRQPKINFRISEPAKTAALILFLYMCKRIFVFLNIEYYLQLLAITILLPLVVRLSRFTTVEELKSIKNSMLKGPHKNAS